MGGVGSGGHNRVPTRLKILRGNPGKEKLPEHEPMPVVPSEEPQAPAYLTGLAAEEWVRLMREFWRFGVITPVDTHQLAAYCMAYDRWRRTAEELSRIEAKDFVVINPENGRASQLPLLITVVEQSREMLRLAREFGFTPAARSRISTLESKPAPHKFAGLIAS